MQSNNKSNVDSEFLRYILITAYSKGASDVHFESYPRSSNVKVLFRMDGVLSEFAEYPIDKLNQVIAYAKITAKIEIVGKSRPISKTLDAGVLGLPIGVALRFTFVPLSTGTDDLVIRIMLPTGDADIFEKFGLRNDSRKALLATKFGTILFTGGTGSGTTVLAISYLTKCVEARSKVLYIDVEPELFDVLPASIRGVKCNSEDDLQLAANAIENANPDIVYLGQLDSKLKTTIAVKVSNLGYVVVANMHANSSAQAIATYLEFGKGIPPWQLLNSLVGVVSQRLVRRLCKRCKQKVVWNEADFLRYLSTHLQMTTEDTEKATGERAQGSQVETWSKKGCDECHGTGYRGRVGVYEYVPINDQLRRLISQDPSYPAINRALTTEEYFSKEHDALRNAILGHVSLEEAEEVARYRCFA